MLNTWIQIPFILFLAFGLLKSSEVFSQNVQTLNTTNPSRLEKSLSSAGIYSIPKAQSALSWLEEFAKQLSKDLVTNPQHSDISHLLLGDAYHWIGHILEERKDFDKAWSAYLLSYDHYKKSSAQSSAFISGLKTRDHGRMHLVELAKKMKKPILPEWQSFSSKRIESSAQIERQYKDYLKHLELAKKRIAEEDIQVATQQLEHPKLRCSSLLKAHSTRNLE